MSLLIFVSLVIIPTIPNYGILVAFVILGSDLTPLTNWSHALLLAFLLDILQLKALITA